jgi:transglutaminase-like putative cysteine protease
MVDEDSELRARPTSPLGIRPDRRYRTVEESRIVDQLLVFGWAFERRAAERARAAREARIALDRLVDQGLPFERRDGPERLFDPAEVLNYIKWAALRHGDPLWRERFVATGRRLVAEHHGGAVQTASPQSPGLLGPRRFRVTLAREINLSGRAPGGRVRVRLPLPLEDAYLSDLSIVRAPRSADDVGVDITPGRLEVRMTVPADATTTLAAELSFIACPTGPTVSPTPLTPAEGLLYTHPNEGIAAIGPKVRALAADLAGDLREPARIVEGFWNFLHDRLIFGGVHYDELDERHPTESVLHAGWYDCHLGSALLVALCRARGIPARIVAGYLLCSAAPTYHYWAEVWLEDRGWFPLDSICADLSAMGRDVAWRNHFFGQLDYRMKTECLPRLFTGNPAVRFPRAWYLLTRIEGEGVDVGFFATDTGALIYRDRIEVHRDASPDARGDLGQGSDSRTNAGPL